MVIDPIWGWDDPNDPDDLPFVAGVVYHPRVDQGMRVRCFECLANVRLEYDIRCEPCRYKHLRRIRCAAKALDD